MPTICAEAHATKQAARVALARMEKDGFETVFFGPCEAAIWLNAVSKPEDGDTAFLGNGRDIWVLVGKMG